jgi:hypothetical protein
MLKADPSGKKVYATSGPQRAASSDRPTIAAFSAAWRRLRVVLKTWACRASTVTKEARLMTVRARVAINISATNKANPILLFIDEG